MTEGLKHTRLPCLSLSPGVCSNLCPFSQCCYPTTSYSVIPFSFCLQSFLASGSFPMRWLFTSGGQSIGISALTSVLPMNIQGWFPLGLTGLILLFMGLSRVFSRTTVEKYQLFSVQPFYNPTLTSVHEYWKKTIALIIWIFVSSVRSLHFNTLYSFVIALFWGTRIF